MGVRQRIISHIPKPLPRHSTVTSRTKTVGYKLSNLYPFGVAATFQLSKRDTAWQNCHIGFGWWNIFMILELWQIKSISHWICPGVLYTLLLACLDFIFIACGHTSLLYTVTRGTVFRIVSPRWVGLQVLDPLNEMKCLMLLRKISSHMNDVHDIPLVLLWGYL